MANVYANILKYGLQAQYNTLVAQSKTDESVLYFCTDTKKIYKGLIDFTDSVVYAAEKPNAPIQGKVYVLSGTGTVETYDGTNWHVLSYPATTSISSNPVENDDVHVPTAKAVYDYVGDAIEEAIGGEGVVASVTASTTEGNITVTMGDGTSSNVAVHGVVTTPTYDGASRTITFPIADGNDVVVELGKDIFIDHTANNRYENGNIYLYLNDGTATTDPTEIVIPATGLITDYLGDDTATISVNVDSNTHKVTASVIIKPNSVTPGEEFTNALQSDANGLYVDLSGVTANVTAAQSTADAANSLATANSAAISTTNVAVSTAQSTADSAGSYAVANSLAISTTNEAVSTAQSTADAVSAATSDAIAGVTSAQSTADEANSLATANSEAVSTVADSANSYAAANSAAISTNTAATSTNTDNISALAIAVGWGTF
jgi:hypothetical protein